MKRKKERKRKQQELLSLGEERKPKLNSSLNSCLCSGGEQREKSAANRPNYFLYCQWSKSVVCEWVSGFYL